MPNRTRTPAQNAARLVVDRKIASGKIKRPKVCPKCGRGDRTIEAMHETYRGAGRGKVKFRCNSCHRKEDLASKRKPGAPVSHHQGQQR